MKFRGKDRILLIVFGALALVVMAAIFCLSQQPGDDSFKLSEAVLGGVKENGLDIFIPKITFGEAPAEGDGSFHFNLEGRKWAHFYLYALLGLVEFLWWFNVYKHRDGRPLRFRPLWAALSAFGFCLIYACTDELHQLFVDSREGRPGDVIYDSLGFGLFIGASLIVSLILPPLIKAFRNRRKV